MVVRLAAAAAPLGHGGMSLVAQSAQTQMSD